METEFVKVIKFFVVNFFFFFIGTGLHAQLEKKIYFLIDKNDTLIKRQIANNENDFEGYLLINEPRVKQLNRTPIKVDKVWVPESDDDFYTFGPTFKFYRKNDKNITTGELIKMNVIKNRREFLCKFSSKFNYGVTSYFFIEPITSSSNYILRRVYPVILE